MRAGCNAGMARQSRSTLPAGLRCNRQIEDAHSPRGNANTGWKAIFPDIRPREVDSIGTNARRAFTVGTFPYRSASQCTRLLDATLMKADSEDTLSERTSYEVLKDNAGCL